MQKLEASWGGEGLEEGERRSFYKGRGGVIAQATGWRGEVEVTIQRLARCLTNLL
jgi:hypothetical protein